METSLLFSRVLIFTLLHSTIGIDVDPNTNCASVGDCRLAYSTAPSGLENSPLACNILGRNLKFECELVGSDFIIHWYFTQDRSQVGPTSSSNLVPGTTTTKGNNTLRSTLTINSFNNIRDSGYWTNSSNAPRIRSISSALGHSALMDIQILKKLTSSLEWISLTTS